MLHTADWYVLFVFGSSLLGLLVSVVLCFSKHEASFPARMLAGFLTSLSLVGLNNALMATDFYLHIPHLWRAVSFASFLPPCFSYLYIRSSIYQEYRFRQHDWWFFVPSLLYVVSMLPFYAQPAAVKLQFIHQIMANHNLIAQEPENILPGGISTLARTLYGIGTSIAIGVMLKKVKRSLAGNSEHLANNLGLHRWMVLFGLIVFFFYISVFFIILGHVLYWFQTWEWVAIIIGITVLYVCLSLLARPSILYGMRGWLASTPEQAPAMSALPHPIENATEPPRRKTSLSPDQGVEIKQLVENHLKDQQPYLKPQYKLADLSKETGIPTYLLSAFINQEYGKNFNEFINDHRVDYLYQLFLTDEKRFSQFTLEGLSKQAGFNSRNAFIASVKRKTGLTPSEYFQLEAVV